jgi:hypothetical protein
MLEAVVILCLLSLLLILFRPRRDPFVRRVTRSFNGLPRWRSQERYW